VFAVDIASGATTDMLMSGLCHPVLSPDGRFVAGIDQSTVDVGSGQGSTVVVELATGNRRQVAEFGGLACGFYSGRDDPAWSADSERLAVVTTDTLRIVGRDGSQPRDIVELELPAGTNPEQRTEVRPLWSPSGDWLAFVSAAGIELVRPDGSQRRLIAPDVTDAGHFAWTPDSTHLDYGIAVGQQHPDGVAMKSFDVVTGEIAPIELVAPYVDAFARQPVTAETPRFVLP
jgi:Tol biopolymer transport system component